jgi:hypothetical protein
MSISKAFLILSDEDSHEDSILEAATINICHWAKDKIAQIIERLNKEGYRFAYPNEVFLGQVSINNEVILKAKAFNLTIPTGYLIWLREVGLVNLMGSHPDWLSSGYCFEDDPREVCYTDPLVIDANFEYLNYQLDEWLESVEEYGKDEMGDFKIDFAPDYIHKAGISGGRPYAISTKQDRFNPLIHHSRHLESFYTHILRSINWCGFPGVEFYANDILDWVVNTKSVFEKSKNQSLIK